MRRYVPCLWMLIAAGCGDAGTESEPSSVPLQIVGPRGETRLDILAEVAATPAERSIGLGGHTTLGPDEGMILVFAGATRACITNRPVPFSIDAIYVSADKRVVALERNLPPGDDAIHCHDSVAYVLEVAASVAATVQVGDTLVGP